MAAPVVSQLCSFGFRDSKGQTAKLRCLIGGATIAAVQTNVGTLRTHLAAMSNAHVYSITYATGPDRTYGSTAQYATVEDKCQLTFVDANGGLHRYQVPAPLAADFLTDTETLNGADANVAAVITDFQTFVYGASTDTSPLVVINGIRRRARFQRKFNILTKNPSLSGPGE